jgi:hypothetical protein
MTQMTSDEKKDDQRFFRLVSLEGKFPSSRRELGFGEPIFGLSLGNAVMLFSRPDWHIPVPESEWMLQIHFEARRRNEFRLEVGPEPYVSSLDSKPDLKRKFGPLLMKKALIMDALRIVLLAAHRLPNGIEVTRQNLLDPSRTASHTIVKFVSDLPDRPTVSQAADFYRHTVETVTPIVCESLRLQRLM